jgi:hypothetical protein
VTDPPAEDKPPIILPPMIPTKLFDVAQITIEMFVSPREACMTGQRP